MLKEKKVAILGGGPGGLTLARLLQMNNVAVTVYERDKDKTVRQQGATLDLHEESGLRALRVAGLIDEFKKHYRPGADKLRVTDEQAVLHFDEHDTYREDEWGSEHFRPEIDRWPLRDLLIASLAEGTICWDAYFVTMMPLGAGWKLEFANGKTAYADVVIAADGANSKARAFVTDIQPIYSGITIIEGNIYNAAQNAPILWALVNGGKVFALGHEKSIGLSAKGEGSLSFYTGTKESENWVKDSGIDFNNSAQVFSWFKTRFADWADNWHELFESDDAYYVPRPQYYCPYDQIWTSKDNCTLIGDAAHRMPPFAGEGVNMAMLDALELYDALCNKEFATVRDAIIYFEQQMLQRAAEVTRETMEATEMLHSEHALEWLVGFFGKREAL